MGHPWLDYGAEFCIIAVVERVHSEASKDKVVTEPSRQPISVTDASVVTALGCDLNELVQIVTCGEASGLRSRHWGIASNPCYVGCVSEVGELLGNVDSSIRQRTGFESRNTAILDLALEALGTALERVTKSYPANRIGIVMGSSTSGIGNAEAMYKGWLESGIRPADYRYAQQEMGTVSEYVSLKTGFSGPSYTISTACSSSAKVFRSARALIDMGLCDAVLVGGCDSLCEMTINGFGSLGLLSPTICSPFSANRAGISIGEGAALFFIERPPSSGQSTHVQLLGVGESSDAYHMSTPDPSGAGARRAMLAALADSGLSPDQIAYINLHGTGTTHNDAMEGRAVAEVFPEGASGVACSGTKGYVGHLLGASGAVEIAIVWGILQAALRAGLNELPLPVHKWDGCYDSTIPPINVVTCPRSVPISGKRVACMSNSFGFGGSNCSVILGLADEPIKPSNESFR